MCASSLQLQLLPRDSWNDNCSTSDEGGFSISISPRSGTVPLVGLWRERLRQECLNFHRNGLDHSKDVSTVLCASLETQYTEVVLFS